MFERKIVAVLNKSVEPGRSMNALAHICLGFGAKAVSSEQLNFMNYQTKDGIEYPNISKMPFIILKATGNKIKNLIKVAREEKIPFGAFTESMTCGTWEDQKEKTNEVDEEEHNFFGVVLMGGKDRVNELTGKFSVWRV